MRRWICRFGETMKPKLTLFLLFCTLSFIGFDAQSQESNLCQEKANQFLLKLNFSESGAIHYTDQLEQLNAKNGELKTCLTTLKKDQLIEHIGNPTNDHNNVLYYRVDNCEVPSSKICNTVWFKLNKDEKVISCGMSTISRVDHFIY